MRLGRFALLVLLVLLSAPALAAISLRTDPIDEVQRPRAPGQVGAQEIGEAATVSGPTPVVRNIIFERSPIFTEQDRARLRWLPLGLINALHVDTRTRVIRRELVFEEGDRVDRALLDESERRLRSTGFFGEAWVDPITVAADTVDILVRTREIWTTSVNVSYERFGGQVLWGLQLRERNFLGEARSFALSRNVDEDRSTWSASLGDRQLFDGRWRGRVDFARSDDGTVTQWGLDRPFFRLDSAWSTGTSYLNRGARFRYYLNGGQYIRPEVKQSNFSLYFAHKLIDARDHVWRLGPGFSYSNQQFRPEDGLVVYDARGETGAVSSLPANVAENRNVRVPYLLLERATRVYTRQRYLYAMGRVEDVPLGFEHRMGLGWAVRTPGSTTSGFWFSTQHEWFGIQRNTVIAFSADTGGLVTSDQAENLRVVGRLSSYTSLGHDTKLAVGLVGGTSTHLDRSGAFLLGLDSGLRAARFREFAGDRLVRGNLELRWIYSRGWNGLVTPGLTAFSDFGSAWFEDETDLSLEDIRGAIGVGLRLGFNRGSEEVPIRIDLGWPILYDNERRGAVLSIGTGQVF